MFLTPLASCQQCEGVPHSHKLCANCTHVTRRFVLALASWLGPPPVPSMEVGGEGVNRSAGEKSRRAKADALDCFRAVRPRQDLQRGTILIERHGDAKLTDLLHTLANCPKARPASIPSVLCRVRAALPLSASRDGISALQWGPAPRAGQRPDSTASGQHKPRALEDGAGQRASVVSPRWRASRAKGGKSTREP
jgi:hypothetical protein